MIHGFHQQQAQNLAQNQLGANMGGMSPNAIINGVQQKEDTLQHITQTIKPNHIKNYV